MDRGNPQNASAKASIPTPIKPQRKYRMVLVPALVLHRLGKPALSESATGAILQRDRQTAIPHFYSAVRPMHLKRPSQDTRTQAV